MIENFEPSPALRSSAPTVTALIYTGDGEKPVDLGDLALCVETGEVVPLSEPAFAVAIGRPPPPSTASGDSPVLAAVADLLGCDATLEAFNRVASLALLQASQNVSAPLAQATPATAAAVEERMAKSFHALLAEMDAAEREMQWSELK